MFKPTYLFFIRWSIFICRVCKIQIKNNLFKNNINVFLSWNDKYYSSIPNFVKKGHLLITVLLGILLQPVITNTMRRINKEQGNKWAITCIRSITHEVLLFNLCCRCYTWLRSNFDMWTVWTSYSNDPH